MLHRIGEVIDCVELPIYTVSHQLLCCVSCFHTSLMVWPKHIMIHNNTLTHKMLNFTGTKESLYDLQNISSPYCMDAPYMAQSVLIRWNGHHSIVNSILRQK